MALITQRVMALENITPNDELFKKILHRGMRDETINNVVLVEKKAATKLGDNYLSCLTRFTLHYNCDVPTDNGYVKEKKVAHLILKEEPVVSEDMLKNIRELEVFETERSILEDVLMRIEELVGRRIGPKIYYSATKPHIIVMEDLAVFGFKNRSRQIGLSMDDVELVIDSIADYHAGTVFLNDQEPGSLSNRKSGILNDFMPETMKKSLFRGVNAVYEVLSTWPEEKYKVIAEKCRKLAINVVEKCRKCYEVDDDEFCVLNHGDLWINNIMFRDDDNGKVQDVRFVDYQVPVWTSPAIDILYFLSICPEYEIKTIHDDMLIERYWKRLVETMTRIGCSTKPPTLEQLKKSIFKRRAYWLMSGLAFYPKIALDVQDVHTLDEMMEQDQSVDNEAVKKPRVVRTFRKILPIIDERGYLD